MKVIVRVAPPKNETNPGSKQHTTDNSIFLFVCDMGFLAAKCYVQILIPSFV